MKRHLVAGAIAVALAAGPGHAAAVGVTLTQPAPPSPNNAALPRIAAPATLATARVNAALAKLDASWKGVVRQCPSGHGSASRTVSVAMAGPTILSLTVHDEASCADTAHPADDTLGFAYDLATGAPLDWMKLLPASLVAGTNVDSDFEGTQIGMVRSPQLYALYAKAAAADASQDKDLRDQCFGPGGPMSADDGDNLQLWPDAAHDAVMAQSFDLGWAVHACGFVEPLSTADLRRLGVNAALLDAIDAAHVQAR